MNDDQLTTQGSVDLLYERYRRSERDSRLRGLYYGVKPLLPRRVQLAIRRAYVPLQRRHGFPAWPIETALVDHQNDEFRRRIMELDADGLAFVGFWPDHRRFCFVLTHDVEGPAGIENVERLLEVERRHGVTSSWNFVAEDYHIPDDLFDHIRGAGCEIGLHGIHHDDELFRDRRGFEQQLPLIEEYLRKWDAVGFRSPATHRYADWMHELPCTYDSSFPDTDPFEPFPGGCCSIFPFFFGRVVELPITLVQDHTLFEILREKSINHWLLKSRWIARNHGLVNVIVHPDYMVDDQRLERYEELLRHLVDQDGGWHALPHQVAQWWIQRARLSVETSADRSPVVAGPSDYCASVAYARVEDGRVVFAL